MRLWRDGRHLWAYKYDERYTVLASAHLRLMQRCHTVLMLDRGLL